MSTRLALPLVAVALSLACVPPPTNRSAPKAETEGSTEPERASGRTTAQIREQGNHLIDEPSPYLQQHAHNPVDWYPWGSLALEKARSEGKPIFLSVGYSTCHWCHVMEEESFEDDKVAAFLNENFVSIKVDREQRPDVDALFIDAVHVMGMRGGWPLTVFMTPKLEPFMGGTYFPPVARGKRPGFMDVLRQVDEAWRSGDEEVLKAGRDVLARLAAAEKSNRGRGAVSLEILDQVMVSVARRRDPQLAGFGQGQKFPNSPLLLAELGHVERTGDPATREHLLSTLDQLTRGGIHDHITGGFHRYAVDRSWHIPHFEKTLYDNAQLAAVFIEAGLAFDRPDLVAIGRGVLDELVKLWKGPNDGLIVGFDADDPGGEGAFYSWSPEQLAQTLTVAQAELVTKVFRVSPGGDRNLDGGSVLHRLPEAELRAAYPDWGPGDEERLREALDVMEVAREHRPKPRIDDKQLVSWNALAIITLADAGRWLDAPGYVALAQRVAGYILDDCWDREAGVMRRGFSRMGDLGPGFLDDYALAGLALLRLHAADGDARWLREARALTDTIIARFWSPEQGVFMSTAAVEDAQVDPASLPIRRPALDDGVMPGGSTAAIRLVLELGALAGDRELTALGERALEVAGAQLRRSPSSAGFLFAAAQFANAPVHEIVIAGDRESPEYEALWAQIRGTKSSGFLIARLPEGGGGASLIAGYPALRGKQALGGAPTVFVCERGSCKAPAKTPQVLRAQLDEILEAAAGGAPAATPSE